MQKLLFTIGITLLTNIVVFSQYDYGLDIQEKDAKISGKLNLVSGTNSIFIGENSGIFIDNSIATENTFIGSEAGKNTTKGVSNTFIGFKSGEKNREGSWNVFMGTWAGQENSTLGTGTSNTFIGVGAGQYNRGDASNNTFIGNSAGITHYEGSSNTFIGRGAGLSHNSGDRNVFLGFQAGALSGSGSDNVFIGYDAGSNHTGDNMLIIENSSSSTPLVYGEFDNDKLQINGSLHITEFARLIPGNAPSSPEKGTMYYDSSDDKVKVWTGSWENLFFNSPSQNETSFNSNPCASDCTNALNKSAKKQELLVQENNVLRERLESVESDLQEMKKMIIQLAENEGITMNSFIVEKQSELEQNIPNPFNGTTKINYYIQPTSQKANLKIFNISGQLVENINITTFGRGKIEVSLENFKNGLFHYSLEVDGQIIDTKKMTSIK